MVRWLEFLPFFLVIVKRGEPFQAPGLRFGGGVILLAAGGYECG